MKRSTLLFTSALAVSTFAITSCKDDEKSKTDLLTGKVWAETKNEITYQGTTIDISTSELLSCEKDDSLTFSKNGNYVFVKGTDDCDGDQEDESGKWSWQNGEKTLHVLSEQDTTDLTLISLKSSTFKVNAGAFDFDIDGDGKDDAGIDLLVTYTAK